MKKIIFIQICFLILIYQLCFSQNKSTIESDRIAINELTDDIEKTPQLFLSKLSIDTNKIAHFINNLGFNYTIENGAFRFNDNIYFWLDIVRLNDSIISFAANPFYWNIKPIKYRAYDRIFTNAGWIMKSSGDFKEKIVNYNSTTLPVSSTLKLKQNATATIDSLMTVHFDFIYPSYIHSLIFNRISHSLTDEDLFFLLHSINPATRAMVIHYIRCSNKTFSAETNQWIDYLIKTSPTVLTQYGCLREKKSLSEIVKCN